MKKLITPLMILILLAGMQAVGVSAQAQSINPSETTMMALAQPSPAQISTYKSNTPEQVTPPQLATQFIPGATIYSPNIGGDEAARLAQEGVYIGPNTSNSFIDLEGGNVLLRPEKDVVIGTCMGKISIGADAAVFIINSGEDIAIYDLLQTKPKQVTITVRKQKFVLEPGRMFVLTKQNIDDFEKLAVDCHRVVYRNAQLLSGNGTVKVFASDFSIASAMVAIQPLKRWTVSNNREDKLVMNTLIKSAVLLGDFATSPTLPLAAQADSVEIANDNN